MSAMVVEKTSLAKKNVPWVEKYRPSKVEEVAHQDEVISTLKKSIDLGTLPHLMFHGPPGTGKTTTILAVARALFGPELYKTRMLELNASDERGISVVRDKVKTFAQGAVGGQKTPGYPCPKFKIIVLDEVDTMTPDAQSALRRIIETYSKVTRFCLICNYVTRVIEPLASRCAKFRFKPLPVESMQVRMRQIAASESVGLSEETLAVLLRASKGDMRKAVTYLQSAFQLTTPGADIDSLTVVDISGQVADDVMDKMWAAMAGRNVDSLRAAVDEMLYSGFALADVLSQLHDEVVGRAGVSDVDKALICEKIAEVDMNLVDGASEALQLHDLAAYIMRRLTATHAEVDAFSASNH
ncbi:putative replication factor C 37 kDa subunit [Ochromonadaceae sp. CCMP2298]|nr:putative replication factor C 37 kDa subunit [Ochromonadaceae sp. CCMP2298]|mmetsp:Transcript_20292/g.45129  ORF Transcript_20292/g.45129 Transcript_20292/m.45129 type:complete len:355 (+) Transcript_20292:154-1218(+)|eukprot:CAMPEP_0173198264 /NCGR_PEP_ID=MMETSP1141-20130122/16597_1 /TAXON_ID=483371 /ORGANISM="non described non described, Strain CCMP2298" /LENGTH=354 /DNA_ID=CAMNT_0014123051 /DNA_START=81 /DNA_END=1145 /DNA_ORIENTATION=-